ncbi:hypothetical protein E3G52_000317 [Mycobacteroides abscessus]|uniref:hypothetical protein n=1 Tax=Mycobacteroides abscessus TaxID=36809 RepID=UPI00187855C9|nr:hypothetical protein [Mycobacteroides abscessus]MBE5453453.1 hypothetical protein [Mycobacteroides abscessus]
MIALLEVILVAATVTGVTMSVLALTHAARRRDQVQIVGHHSTAIQSGGSVSIQASHGSVAS